MRVHEGPAGPERRPCALPPPPTGSPEELRATAIHEIREAIAYLGALRALADELAWVGVDQGQPEPLATKEAAILDAQRLTYEAGQVFVAAKECLVKAQRLLIGVEA